MKIRIKECLKKILIVLLVFMIINNYLMPNVVCASIGGVLLEPIFEFVTFIDDSIIGLLQTNLMTSSDVLIDAYAHGTPETGWQKFFKGTFVGAIIVGGVTLLTGGVAAPLIAGGVAALSILQYNHIDNIKGEMVLPNTRYTPYAIFAGLVPLLNTNFIGGEESKTYEVIFSDGDIRVVEAENRKSARSQAEEILEQKIEEYKNTENNDDIEPNDIEIFDINKKVTSGEILREVIASWYITLRNIALVGLLIILVYIGIKILMSSVAEDKAKYKKMLKDWFIALCMIFILHYIMTFTTVIINKIQELFIGNSTEMLVEGLSPYKITVDFDNDGERETSLENNKIYAFTGEIVGEVEPEDEDTKPRAYYLTNFMRTFKNWT